MLGISDDFEQYSDISDDELDQIYKEMTTADTNVSNGGFVTPNIGRRRFIGALKSRGLRVQCWRVSNCLRRLDCRHCFKVAVGNLSSKVQCSNTQLAVAL